MTVRPTMSNKDKRAAAFFRRKKFNKNRRYYTAPDWYSAIARRMQLKDAENIVKRMLKH